MRDFKLIITGQECYIPGGIRVEDISISDEDIEEVLQLVPFCLAEVLDGLDINDAETEAIQYILREHINEWEQGFCNAIVVTTELSLKLKELL